MMHMSEDSEELIRSLFEDREREIAVVFVRDIFFDQEKYIVTLFFSFSSEGFLSLAFFSSALLCVNKVINLYQQTTE